MPLVAGQTLSFYEILGPLGAGGMGEVYRARDTRLEREVAIKVLPEELADDEERLRRFEREAKTLATLQHANVAAIFGIDQVEDTCFIAMELVGGEDLAEHLRRGPLPLDEALDVCRQIAEGLEAAHEAGVIHRDLKPANVRITPDGVVKLLDFGLAKPMLESTSGSSVTAKPDSYLATAEGMVLGTPTYMSPEQARGKAVDRRTDVWAFGCVLFECLTGRRAFGGEAIADVLGAIVGTEPDWGALPAETPPRVVELLRRCLDKSPRTRLRDIGEARVLLADPGQESAPAATGRDRKGILTAAAVVAIGLVIAAWLWRPASAPAPSPARLSVSLDVDSELSAEEWPNLALSRDGTTLAWVGGPEQRLHVRRLDSYDVEILAGTERATCPSFSPDGQWLAYSADDRLMKVAVQGNPPIELLDEQDYRSNFFNLHQTPPRGVSWGDDGWIVFSPSTVDVLYRVPDRGGEPEILTAFAEGVDERTHRWPEALPGGAVLFTVDDSSSPEFYDDANIELITPAGERRVLVEGASHARYSDGVLAFARGGALYAQPIVLGTWELRGEPRSVIPDLRTDVASGATQFALSAGGTLAYVTGGSHGKQLLLGLRGLDGSFEPLELPAAAYFEPRVSPDGRRIVFALSTSNATDLWVYDLGRRTMQRLTTSGTALGPTWMRDGESVLFESRWPKGLFRKRIEGGGEPEEVLSISVSGKRLSGRWSSPGVVLEGDRVLLFAMMQEGTGLDLVLLDLETREITEFVRTPADESAPALSPDGRWVAYQSDTSSTNQVYVTDRRSRERHRQVSSDGGSQPIWSADGRTLYYLRQDAEELWAVDVTVGDELDLGVPRLVMEGFFYDQDYRLNYDLVSDGRFITIVGEGVEQPSSREIRIVPGWTDSVR